MIAVSETINWSRMSLDELKQFYFTEIEPDLGGSETEIPSYQDLADHGYSGIAYALREHHDLTVKEFFTDVVGLSPQGSDAYEWGIDATETVERLNQYLESRSNRHDLADSTIRSRRTRLAKYARTYAELHGQTNLVERATRLETQPEEITRAIAVFDALDEELESDDSKRSHLNDVEDFYLWLQNRAVAEYNPMVNVRNEFSDGWDTDQETKPALDADQVRALYEAAASDSERFLVLALGAWGLRRSEVAALHVSQFVPNAEPPRVEFDERKNGPSSVQLLFGVDLYLDRVEELDGDDWNGYLFPSSASESGHIAPGTVNNRFRALVERAGVTLRGENPTPHACRRFWYRAYQDAMADLRESVEIVADEQGSSSAQVVIENYLGEEQARRARRDHMRERLSEAFSGKS